MKMATLKNRIALLFAQMKARKKARKSLQSITLKFPNELNIPCDG